MVASPQKPILAQHLRVIVGESQEPKELSPFLAPSSGLRLLSLPCRSFALLLLPAGSSILCTICDNSLLFDP